MQPGGEAVRKVDINAAETNEESFQRCYLPKIGKSTDIHDFKKGQIIMGPRLGTNMSDRNGEADRLLACYCRMHLCIVVQQQ